MGLAAADVRSDEDWRGRFSNLLPKSFYSASEVRGRSMGKRNISRQGSRQVGSGLLAPIGGKGKTEDSRLEISKERERERPRRSLGLVMKLRVT